MYRILALLIYLFFLLVIGGGVYMVPSIIAIARRHNITKVILFNIFLLSALLALKMGTKKARSNALLFRIK